MALFASISASPLSIPSTSIGRPRPITISRRLLCPLATLSSSSSSHESAPASTTHHDSSIKNPSVPVVESSRSHDSSFNYALDTPSGGSSSNPVVQFVRSTESNIERVLINSLFMLNLLIILSIICQKNNEEADLMIG